MGRVGGSGEVRIEWARMLGTLKLFLSIPLTL